MAVRSFYAFLMIAIILVPHVCTQQCLVFACMASGESFVPFTIATIYIVHPSTWFLHSPPRSHSIFHAMFICPFVVKYSNYKPNIIYRCVCSHYRVPFYLLINFTAPSVYPHTKYNVHFDGPVLDLNG